jgi:hypothetical protein
MSIIGFKKLFQLKDNFTKEELKSSFMKKVQEVNNNNNLSEIDKKFWLEQLIKLYNQGKNEFAKNNSTMIPFSNDIFNNNFLNFNDIYSNHINQINNMNNMVSSFKNLDLNEKNITNSSIGHSKSYKSFMGNDGIKYVEETTKSVNNNKVNSKITTYKIDKNGNKTFIDPKEFTQIK